MNEGIKLNIFGKDKCQHVADEFEKLSTRLKVLCPEGINRTLCEEYLIAAQLKAMRAIASSMENLEIGLEHQET